MMNVFKAGVGADVHEEVFALSRGLHGQNRELDGDRQTKRGNTFH